MRKNTVETIVSYLNINANIKDKRVYMSLLYLNRYILKDTVIKDFGANSKLFDDSHWLKILNKRCVFPLKNAENIKIFLDRKLNTLQSVYGTKLVEVTRTHYKNIGLYQALNDENINTFIQLMDTLEITVDDIFDIYTQINMPDKSKNDFFTPLDICSGISKISAYKNIEDKQTISIYDPTCGVGNLLYTTFKEIKTKNANIKVEVFGNDLDKTYYSFAMSIFNLFNFENSYFENKNILTEYPLFNNKKMDLIISNPPFGKSISNCDYLKILKTANKSVLTKSQLKLLKNAS